MKAFRLLILVIILSVNYSRASHRLLPARQSGSDNKKLGGFSQGGYAGNMEKEDTWDPMCLEKCEDGNDECLKRRATSEAHLDYIYTQRNNKP